MLCRCWAMLLVGIDRSFCAKQIVGIYNYSGRSSLGLRILSIYFELRDRGLPWLLITKTERTVFATQHNRCWDSLWPRDSAISRWQLQMVRYGSFASPCFLWKMLTLNSKPTKLVFSIFHHKVPSLQAEWHFFIVWKIQLFSAKYFVRKMSCSAACFPLLCAPLILLSNRSELTDAFSLLFAVPDKG